MRVALAAVLACVAAVAAPPKALMPKATLSVGKGQLQAWSYCPAKSLVAALQGKQLVLARLDVGAGKLEVLGTYDVDTWAMEFSADCGLLVVSEDKGDEQHRVHTASVWRVEGKKLTRRSELEAYRYPVSSLALSEDGAWLAVAVNTGELVLYALDAAGTAKRSDAVKPLDGGDMYLKVRFSHGKLLAGAYRGAVRLFTLDAAHGKLSAPVALGAPTAATRETGHLNVETGEAVVPGGARVFDVAFTADAARAWAVVESGQVFAWELGAQVGPRVTVVDGLEGANLMALSPDGASLMAAGNYRAQVWKLDGTKATAPATLDGLDHAETYVLAHGAVFTGKGRLVVGTGDLYSGKLVLYAP